MQKLCLYSHSSCHSDTEGKAPDDPLAALEKTTDAQTHLTKVQVPRLEALMDVSEHYNSDPYSLSTKVRKRFREDKKIRKEKEKADDQVRDRYALPSTLSLVEEDADARKEAKEEWAKGREELLSRERKRRKLPVETSLKVSYSSSSSRASGSRGSTSSSASDALRARILGNTARRSSLGKSIMK